MLKSEYDILIVLGRIEIHIISTLKEVIVNINRTR